VVGAGSEIIQQGIDNLREQNARANGELTDILANMRANLGVPFGAIPQQSANGSPDDLQQKRIELSGSQWASEVIMAAAVKDEFKEQIGELARAILIAADMYPAATEPNDNNQT
jgi:hypothetical protein